MRDLRPDELRHVYGGEILHPSGETTHNQSDKKPETHKNQSDKTSSHG
jgi:hypothetical protein